MWCHHTLPQVWSMLARPSREWNMMRSSRVNVVFGWMPCHNSLENLTGFCFFKCSVVFLDFCFTAMKQRFWTEKKNMADLTSPLWQPSCIPLRNDDEFSQRCRIAWLAHLLTQIDYYKKNKNKILLVFLFWQLSASVLPVCTFWTYCHLHTVHSSIYSRP